MIKLNTKYIDGMFGTSEFEMAQEYVNICDKLIKEGKGPGNEFLGWYDLPEKYNTEEFKNILLAANKIKNESKVLIVIGIGGSYLGSKAVIEMLRHQFANQVKKSENDLEIYFAGQNISSTYLNELKDVIGDKDFSINVISKSGTTTEPAIAFRFFKDLILTKYGEEGHTRIYATTDESKGALKEQADTYNWETFVVPDNVGGRFSVLTAVGLLPIAASGIDIVKLMSGAIFARESYQYSNLDKNDAYKYAVIRNLLLQKGFSIEMLIGYEPKLTFFNEWWKQLFGESEGKNHKGLFPASAIFSTDLHSLGQLIQEGQRTIFETIVDIQKPQIELTVPVEDSDLDGLSYLNGEKISVINAGALKATSIAHNNGGTPNIILEIEELTEETVGFLIYFFELSCAMSGYLLGVNPFDQPGVESYKENMFALLGKPGFEKIRAELLKD